MTGFFDEIKELLNDSMFNEIKKTINVETKSNIIFENEVLNVSKMDFIEIEIKKDCTLNEYSKTIDKCDEVKNVFIPTRMLFKDDKFNYSKQKLFVIKIDDLKYFINISDNRLLISQNQILDSNIIETNLNIDLIKQDYKITKYYHDINYSTKEVKCYSQNKENLKMFFLEKAEAFKLARDLLINLNKIDNIDSILNVEYMYMILNIVKEDRYNPIISDDLITLSWPYKKGDINQEKDINFEIILNETKEIIGEICFNYNLDGFSYRGNVGYFVNQQYRGNHYATRALKLLKELLKNNTFDGDKDLYLSTVLDNVKSQSVIKNNGGKLVYEGEVPEYNSINYIDGIEEVKVYKIDMKKKS